MIYNFFYQFQWKSIINEEEQCHGHKLEKSELYSPNFPNCLQSFIRIADVEISLFGFLKLYLFAVPGIVNNIIILNIFMNIAPWFSQRSTGFFISPMLYGSPKTNSRKKLEMTEQLNKQTKWYLYGKVIQQNFMWFIRARTAWMSLTWWARQTLAAWKEHKHYKLGNYQEDRGGYWNIQM